MTTKEERRKMQAQKIIPLYTTHTENLMQKFINNLRETEDLQEKTIKEYQSDLKHYITWLKETGRQDPIQDTAATTITAYRDYMQKEKKLKPATTNRRLITLKRLFEWTQKEGHTPQNPAKAARLLPEERTSPRQMTDKEEAGLIAAAGQEKNLRDLTIITLMSHTGLRTMEVSNAQKEDIYIGPKSGKITIRAGKRQKWREVPLNSTARTALSAYLNSSPESNYLFPSQKTGSRYSERGIRFMIQKHMKTAGIEGLSPHDLRHRFGYTMAKKVPLHRLAQLMGHDSLDTTKIYVQATLEDLQKDVEKINWE